LKILLLSPLIEKKIEDVKNKLYRPLHESFEKAKRLQNIMTDIVEQRKQEEEEINGLVIIRGLYGKLDEMPNFNENSKPSRIYNLPPDTTNIKIFDVTLPLQYLIEDSKLELYKVSKSSLIGFFDPCPLETKFLEIIYRYQGEMYIVTIKDIEELHLP